MYLRILSPLLIGAALTLAACGADSWSAKSSHGEKPPKGQGGGTVIVRKGDSLTGDLAAPATADQAWTGTWVALAPGPEDSPPRTTPQRLVFHPSGLLEIVTDGPSGDWWWDDDGAAAMCLPDGRPARARLEEDGDGKPILVLRLDRSQRIYRRASSP